MELPKDQPDQPVQPVITGSGLNLSATSAPQKSSKKLYLTIAIFLIVAVIGGGAFFFLKSSGGDNGSESIPSLKKATTGLQGKLSEQELFLKVKPKSYDNAKKEIEESTDPDKKAKGTEFFEKKEKDSKYKSDMIAEFAFNTDNKGLYLFFPNKDMSFKEIRDSIVSVDNKEEIQVMFAGWNPELGSGEGQWMATEQNYYDKTNIKELESDNDLDDAVVKKGQGVVIMAPANIMIPGGHDSTFSAGGGLFDWRKVNKGWVLLSAHGDTLGETFKDDCLNRVSTVFVQDNAKTADMKNAFVKVDLADTAKFKNTNLKDKGFYAVWVYVNDQECNGGVKTLGGEKVKVGEENNADGIKTGGKEKDDVVGGGDSSLTKQEALAILKEASCFYNSDDSGVSLELKNDKWIMSKTGCLGTCEVGKSNAKDISISSNEMCTGASVSADLNPSNVQIDVTTYPDSVKLTWGANSAAAWYDVYYAADGDTNFASITAVASDSLPNVIISADDISEEAFTASIYNLDPGNYQFKVVGLDENDNPGSGLDSAAVVNSGELVVQPADLNPINLTFSDETYTYTDDGYGYVILSWVPNVEAVDYKVYIENGENFVELSKNPSSENSLKVYALFSRAAIFNITGEDFKAKVVGVDSSGKEGNLESAPVVQVSNLELKALPDNEVVVVDNRIVSGAVDLMWKKDSEYTDYVVLLSVDGGGFVELFSADSDSPDPHLYMNSNNDPGITDIRHVEGGYRFIEVINLPKDKDFQLKLTAEKNRDSSITTLGIVSLEKF